MPAPSLSAAGDSSRRGRATTMSAAPADAPVWRWPLAYGLTAVTFLAMDAVWLSNAYQKVYQPGIGHLMAPTVDWVAGAIFYLLYIGGVVFFARRLRCSRAAA